MSRRLKSVKRSPLRSRALGCPAGSFPPDPAGPSRRREAWTIAAGMAVTIAVVAGGCWLGWQVADVPVGQEAEAVEVGQ